MQENVHVYSGGHFVEFMFVQFSSFFLAKIYCNTGICIGLL